MLLEYRKNTYIHTLFQQTWQNIYTKSDFLALYKIVQHYPNNVCCSDDSLKIFHSSTILLRSLTVSHLSAKWHKKSQELSLTLLSCTKNLHEGLDLTLQSWMHIVCFGSHSSITWVPTVKHLNEHLQDCSLDEKGESCTEILTKLQISQYSPPFLKSLASTPPSVNCGPQNSPLVPSILQG